MEALCSFLQLTLEELASFIFMNHRLFALQVAEGKISGPACLLLTIMEKNYMDGHTDVITNLFNFHGRQKTAGETGLHAGKTA